MYNFNHILVGTSFINLKDNFSDIKLLSVINISDDGQKVIIKSDKSIEIDLEKFDCDPFPNLKGSNLEGRFIVLRKVFALNYAIIIKVLFNTPLKRISINDAVTFYKNGGLANISLEVEECIALVKFNIAIGTLKYQKYNNIEYVTLIEETLESENKKKFLKSIADEIISKSERIELLINHNPTKGNYREYLLRGVLKKYLPNKYSVSTGFIEGCKRQCDIIIYDSINFSPFFCEDGLVIVPIKSVRAIIEVKTSLDSNSLRAGLELLSDVASGLNIPVPIFKGIFAFKNQFKYNYSIASVVSDFYNEKDETDNNKLKNEIKYLYEFINSICVLNKACILIDVNCNQNDESIRPRIYSAYPTYPDENIYSSTFFKELFYFLDVDKFAKKVNLGYFDKLEHDFIHINEKEIFDKDWMPTSIFYEEHNYTFNEIKTRVSDVSEWKHGIISAQDLEEIYYKKRFNK